MLAQHLLGDPTCVEIGTLELFVVVLILGLRLKLAAHQVHGLVLVLFKLLVVINLTIESRTRAKRKADDGMDLEEVSAATTEQVYVLTNDASVADQPPSVESVTVVPSGKNGRDDDPGNETPWWIVSVSIGCVIG